jgi:prepilin-type processing-associated H-X9-DG protein
MSHDRRSWIGSCDGFSCRPRTVGFSLVELLVVLGIGVILLSIFVPYLRNVRESNHRLACQENLRRIQVALTAYAADNGNNFPRVRYDAQNSPNGYVAFTGPDSGNPFAADSAVKPNDVTASLWLLLRLGLLKGPEEFICPSSDDSADPMVNGSWQAVSVGQRGNFRGGENLSYSYASPFSSAVDYRLNDTQPSEFAVLADKNPGLPDVTAAGFGDPPLEQARGNSRNHDRAGQNVLYADGHVAFTRTPYCGFGNDNIYTALTQTPLRGTKPPATSRGFLGSQIGPSWQADSYLVPAGY